MSKKQEKKEAARFETSLGATLRNNWVEVSTESAETATVGAAGGLLVELVFGVGSAGVNAAIGAASGAAVGFARGMAVCHQREARLARLKEEVMNEVESAFEKTAKSSAVADAIRDVAAVFAAAIRAGAAKPPEEDSAAPTKKRGAGAAAAAP